MFYELADITSVRAVIPNEHGELLLLHRTAEHRNNPNLYEFPGGKLTPEEVSHAVNGKLPRDVLCDALEREINEETGLDISRIGQFVVFERRIMRDAQRDGELFLCVGALVHTRPGAVRLNPEEHDDLRFVNTRNPGTRDITLSTAVGIAKYNGDELTL